MEKRTSRNKYVMESLEKGILTNIDTTQERISTERERERERERCRRKTYYLEKIYFHYLSQEKVKVI